MIRTLSLRHYNPPSSRNAAFTLIETIVVIVLTTLISGVLGSLIRYFYIANTYTLEQTVALAQARTGVEDTVRYLREASYASDGSYPIENAATSTITFYAKMDTNPTVEKIVYRLLNGTLYRAVMTPTGNPLTYVGAPYATSTIASSVINDTATPIFHYFDTTGTELPTPTDVSKISAIKITLLVDVNVNRAPTTFTLSGAATLRNLYNQL